MTTLWSRVRPVTNASLALVDDRRGDPYRKDWAPTVASLLETLDEFLHKCAGGPKLLNPQPPKVRRQTVVASQDHGHVDYASVVEGTEGEQVSVERLVLAVPLNVKRHLRLNKVDLVAPCEGWHGNCVGRCRTPALRPSWVVSGDFGAS